jgi:hypothetical protein
MFDSFSTDRAVRLTMWIPRVATLDEERVDRML